MHEFEARRRRRTRLAAGLVAMVAAAITPAARAAVWQPSPGHVQTPIWPGTPPDLAPDPKPEGCCSTDVSRPTMTIYAPTGHNTGVAVVVFPGGGYQVLAMDLEGTEICDWLTSRGMTCVLLKYRVPTPVRPRGTAGAITRGCRRRLRRAADAGAGAPARRAVACRSAQGRRDRLFRRRAPGRRGQHPLRPADLWPVDAADALSCRPDFAIAVYPGHLWAHEDEADATRDNEDLSLRPDIRVRADTPPTFLLQAENDDVDGVEQALAYYVALQKAGVPTEMHLYARGGHAFGLRSPGLPIGRWPQLVETWLHTIGMLGQDR